MKIAPARKACVSGSFEEFAQFPQFPLTLARASVPNSRESRLISAPPPSEPDGRISRIRLSSWWFYLKED